MQQLKAFSNEMAPNHNFFWIDRWSFKGTKKDRYSDGIFQILSRNLILIVVVGPTKVFSTSWADSYFVNKNIQNSKEIHFCLFSYFENEALFNALYALPRIISETKWSMAAGIVNIWIA
jgi:putative flippase GtrA